MSYSKFLLNINTMSFDDNFDDYIFELPNTITHLTFGYLINQ